MTSRSRRSGSSSKGTASETSTPTYLAPAPPDVLSAPSSVQITPLVTTSGGSFSRSAGSSPLVLSPQKPLPPISARVASSSPTTPLEVLVGNDSYGSQGSDQHSASMNSLSHHQARASFNGHSSGAGVTPAPHRASQKPPLPPVATDTMMDDDESVSVSPTLSSEEGEGAIRPLTPELSPNRAVLVEFERHPREHESATFGLGSRQYGLSSRLLRFGLVVTVLLIILGVTLTSYSSQLLDRFNRHSPFTADSGGHTWGSDATNKPRNGTQPGATGERFYLPQSATVTIVAVLGFLSSALPVPTLYTLSCLAAGYSLGFWVGSITFLPPLLFGLVFVFYITRRFLRTCAYHTVVVHYPVAQQLVDAHHATSILILRLTPLPFALQTMLWASASQVNAMTHTVLSSLIVVPQVFAVCYIGSNAPDVKNGLTSGNWKLFSSMFALVILYSAIGYWAKKKVNTVVAHKAVQ